MVIKTEWLIYMKQVSFEFVKMVSASTIADVELKLSSIENGKGLIDALNNKSE